MGKNFARKIATMLLSLAMVFSCLFVFSACKDEEDPANEVNVTSISVALAENSPYTLTENVLDAFYVGEKIEFTASDFVVTALKSDNTTAVLSQKTDTVDGYTLSSTVPAEGITAVGEYKLTFSYTGVSNVEIQVKVNKGNIDVSGVTLKSLTYDGTEQTLQIADILNLPENVTAEFVSGNSGTTVQNYDAVVRFTYTGADAESYNPIPDATITWTMEKANYNVSNISWVGGENIVYTGLPQTVEIEIDGELPEGVTLKGYLNNEYTNAGNYTAKVQFNYDSLNYNKPAVEDFEWSIKEAPLKVKANDAEIIFGAAAIHTGVSYTGFVNGETKDVLGGELSYEYGTYHIGSDVGTYDILPSGLSAENYSITYETGRLVVSKATYSYDVIEWNYDGPYTYNNTVQKPTVTGVPELVGYDVVAKLDGVENESANAGSYVAEFTVLNFKNYDFEGTVPTMPYVINKTALSITANNNTITFGDEPSHAGVLAEGFKGSDTLDIFENQEFIYEYNYVVGDDAGTYTITVSGVTSINYDITFHTGTLTVQAITLQYSDIEFNYDEAFDYDGTAKALTVSGVPTYVDYSISYTKGGNTVTPKDAGTYVASFVAEESDNYVFMGQVPTQEFVINKIALTITANDNTITFGDEPSHASVSYDGFIDGENELVLGGDILFTYGSYEAGDDIGDYDIEISGRTAVNYEISYVSGKLTVEPLQVNVSSYTWNYTSLTYSGVAQEPTLNEISPYISANYTYTQNEAPAFPINVGSYTASVTFNTSKNYEVVGSVADLPFAIGKASLVVTANDHAIYYQDAASDNGVSYTGFVNGETVAVLGGELSFAYDYEQGDDVDDYTITPSGLTSDNYDIQFVQGTLTVQKIVVAISNFVWDYESDYTYTGVAQKPILTNYPNYLNFTSYSYTKGLVEDESIDAGTYLAVATFEESDNYEIAEEVAIEYTINKAALTITAEDKTITYLDDPANNGVRYLGFVNSETSDVLQGVLVYDYEGYVSGSNVGTYRITPNGLSSNNYEISYVAGLLTIEAIIHNYNEISFNYTGAETFVYNGTAVEFVAQMVPDYVTYNIVYKENDETVVDEAVDAGTYSVTFVPQTSVNYVFEGEPLKVEFTINKATINADELYFTIDGVKVTTVVPTEGEGPTGTIYYKEEMYFDGAEHEVDFVNNTGIEGIEIIFPTPEELKTIKNINTYQFYVSVTVPEAVLKNYEELEASQMLLTVIVNDYLKAVKVTYINRITVSAEDINVEEVTLSRDVLTTKTIDGRIIDLEVVLADEGLEGVYFANLYSERYTTLATDNLSNLNIYDNTIYLATNFSDSLVFDEMAIKFVMNFSADTIEDSQIIKDEYEIRYATNESTIKSINVETESILLYANNYSSLFTTSVEIGYVQYNQLPEMGPDGEPQFEVVETFTSEAYTLQPGVNSLLIRYNYTYDSVTYSYTRKVEIVYSVSSEGNFIITYKSENGNVTGANNTVEISDIAIEDIMGNDMMTANPMTAIQDICENIDVTAKTAGNYEEEVGPEGESLRTVEISGGNAYLRIPLKEKPDDGFVVFPGPINYSYTTDGDESVGGDTEGSEAETTTVPLVMYILLNFGFDIDFNTNANVYADGGSVIDAGEFGYIQMKTGHFLNVTAENESAMLVVMRIGDSLEGMGDDWIPTEYQMFYGRIENYVFDQTGYYSLTIMPTASIFMAEYEPKAYIIEVTSSSGEGGGDVVNPEIIYNVQAQDYLGHGVNNTGMITNETPMCEIVVEDDVITLTNWDNTKYLTIATNGDDLFVVDFEGNTIIEKWASNFVMNFEQAGTYTVTITRNVNGEPVVKTITINVTGFEYNFLNITANDSNISVDLTRTKDFTSEDAVSYNDMLPDNQGNYDDNFYIEAYIGAVAGLGSIYELAFTSVYSNLIYEVDTDATILYENGKAILDVKTDGTYNYVEFEIKNPNTPNGAISPETVVKVYFCDKEDRLNYHTLTIGSSTYQVALDLTRAGDYGTLIYNYVTGGAYAVVKESDTNTNITADATFTAYEGYARPAGSYEYLMFTADAYYVLMEQVGDGTISTRAEFDAFIASAKAESQVFEPTNSTSMTITLTFDGNGASELYIASVNLTQQVLDYAFEMIEYLIQPIEIRIDGVYQEPDYEPENPGQGGSGGGIVTIPSYNFKTPLPEGVEISIEVNEVVYSTETNDIMFEEALPAYYIRLKHTYAELVNPQTGKVTITSIASSIPGFVLKDMYEQVIEFGADGSFEVDVQPYVQFGYAAMFVGGVDGMGTAMFILAFEDSIPQGYEPYGASNPDVFVSLSFNDKTYSTDSNRFYFKDSGNLSMYTRIDLTEADVRPLIYEGEPGTGWIDLTNITINVSNWLTPDYSFVGYVDGWTRENYQELKAGGLANYGEFGLVIALEARYSNGNSDYDRYIYIYLVLKDSVSQPCQDSGNPGQGGSGSESGAECVIDMYYNNFADSLSIYSDFSGEFVLDEELTDYETIVVFVATLDASVLNGASTFTLNWIEYNTELLGYVDASDGNTLSPVNVTTISQGGEVYTISENVTLTVIDNSVALQVIGYDDAEKQEIDMTYLFVINFVTTAA